VGTGRLCGDSGPGRPSLPRAGPACGP
jgi:hypothetical protein